MRFRVLSVAALTASALVVCSTAHGEVNLRRAVVIVRREERGPAETMAATILTEEVQRRTGVELPVRDRWPKGRQPVIVITTRDGREPWSQRVPRRKVANVPEARCEGFAIRVVDNASPEVFVVGADGRGAMFGVGRLLRELRCEPGTITINASFTASTAPEYPMRGHELGYRARANSYDAWTPQQYEQYIRELILFGVNCIQNIPFEDARTNSLMKVSRQEMNRTLGEICARYDIDYWVWTPAAFSLDDVPLRKAALEQHESFYRSTPRLDAVFFPGGDPGDNPPELVMPFLEELAARLAKHHPNAKIWLSLQYFDAPKITYVMRYISREKPGWLGGIVADTSALSVRETRLPLPKQYGLRWYPDITHTVECQFPVNWWDPAYALTLGREPTNPRPAAFASVFRRHAPHTDGFVSYSDGINDDVNKAVWCMLGWNSKLRVRDMLLQYARVFFGECVAQEAADGLLGLESNWRGGLANNAGVDGVLALWRRMEKQHPELMSNWRFQTHLMRAYYDAYTRHRLIYETSLERKAMHVLERAPETGAASAMDDAWAVLHRAQTMPCKPRWRKRIDELAEAAFHAIGYQTSVKRYRASGAERGCVMDFIDRPLNNRWWLQDEFVKIRKLDSERKKLIRLERIRAWDNPGPGSFYDDVGHVGRSPHVVRGEMANTDPEMRRHENPGHRWVDNGKSRWRLAWLHHMSRPIGLSYDGLDITANYTVRLTGQGESHIRADGVSLSPTKYSKQVGEFKEFPVPPDLTADGELLVTFDPIDESQLDWRDRSHVAEAWLLKHSLPAAP